MRAKCEKYCRHLAGLLNVECAYIEVSEESRLSSLENPNRFCANCIYEKRDELKTHMYGCKEAYRWNGKYIYYCPLGLVFVSASITNEEGHLIGGILQGPMIMGELMDTLHVMEYKSMCDDVSQLPLLTPSQVTDLSEILASITCEISGIYDTKEDTEFFKQEELLNTLYDVKEKYFSSDGGYEYPIELETNLRRHIINSNKEGFQKLLNEMLGHIYFSSVFDLKEIKMRVLELIVIISRAAIQAGADIREMFSYSEKCIEQINEISSMEEFNVWLVGIMNRFINSTFNFAAIKHADIIYKTIEYIRNNYYKKMSLDDIANHVYMSKAYLSSVFKQETGSNISAYINKIRVEKSKFLLLDDKLGLAEVAILCGFENQSYFTKVFKSITGCSPKKYRDSRGSYVENYSTKKYDNNL